MHVFPLRAVIGRVALVLGATIAGGCTSGHGTSGLAALSKSSLVTMGAMFASENYALRCFSNSTYRTCSIAAPSKE